MEHVQAMAVEDVFRAKEGYHVEESVLVQVELVSSREGAREEVDCRGRCVRMKPLESLEGGASV